MSSQKLCFMACIHLFRPQYLCSRHFNMIESLPRCESQRNVSNNDPVSDAAEVNDNEGSAKNSQQAESSEVLVCSYCKKEFDSRDDVVNHEKDCGAVDEATELSGE